MLNPPSVMPQALQKNSMRLTKERESTLIWAIVCSVLLHVCMVIVIPQLKPPALEKPALLEVTITAPAAPEAPVALEPVTEPVEEIKPEVIKPEVKPLPKPIIKPSPIVEPTQPTAEVAPPQPAVITTQAPSPIVAPPAPVIAPTPPTPAVVTPKVNQEDLKATKNGYGNTLWSLISKHKKYPRIAQTRGWQGEVILELLLDGNGKLLEKNIIQSSGYDSLDQQALEMVTKAAPFPTPPDALRGNNFTIKVPIPFKLESE